MSNTFDAVLSALGPDHTWKMDEASGLYVDSGSGSLDLTPSAPANTWRQASGIIRGEPREYGFWNLKGADAGNGGIAAAESPVGWTTGTWGCWLQIFDTTPLDLMYPLAMAYNGSPSVSGWMRVGQTVSAAGAFAQMRIQDGADFISWRTDSGAIVPGVPYFVCFVHDGVTPVVYLDAVAVGPNLALSGASVASDYFDGVIGTAVVSSITNMNGLVGVTERARGLFQRPFVFRNKALTSGEVASLFAAGNADGLATDYYETVPAITENSLRYWVPGWSVGGNDRMPMQGVAPQLDANGEEAVFVPNNGSGNNVANEIIGTDYAAYKQIYGTTGPSSTQIQMSEPANVDGTETTGTINIIGTTKEVDAGGGTKNAYYHGHNLGPNAEEEISVALQGSASGAQIVYTINTNNAVNFFVATGDTFIPIETLVMISVVQDGAGIKLYLNGVEESFTVASGGAGIDATSWFADLPFAGVDNPNADVLVLGGEDGASSTRSWEPNELNEVWMATKAMTADEIAEIWDAVNDIFPQPPPADLPGDFVAVIDTTGNNGTGPDHWWRMNEADGQQLADIGVSVIDGETITIGGDPDYEVTGPLPRDATNEAIFFDGQGDYFEVGVDAIAGQLEAAPIGTAAFFFSAKLYDKDNWAYSQADDLGNAFWNFGVSNDLVQLSADDGTDAYTLTSSIPIADYDFIFAVVTSDGDLYFNGVLDTSSVAVGILQWWDEITATRTAIAATADQNFTTETIGRFSEILLWEEVLTAAQIAAIWAAIQADGIAGLANVLSVLTFENVTFRNGGEADVRVENTQAEFTQVLQVDQCRFIGGAEGGQGVLLNGANIAAQIDGNEFDLQATPITGREAIRATTADPATAPTVYSSLIATDNTLKGMGTVEGAAIFAESGFGMTVDKNRIRDSLGAGIGWRGDAQRVLVRRNQVEGVGSAVAGICAKQGLNTAGGQNWQVRGNTVLDVTDGNGIRIEGKNSDGLAFASGVQVLGNVVGRSFQPIFIDGVRESAIMDNELDGGTEGIRIGELLGSNLVRRNVITGHSAEGIIMAEAAAQVATLILDRNTINGNLSADGVLVSGVDTLVMNANKILSTVNAMQLGNIATRVLISRNQIEATTTVLFLIGSTTQSGMQIFGNIMPSLGDAEALTVAANAVEVTGNYHTLTSVGAVDLNTIGGQTREGAAMILRLAAGSADITAKDGADDMELAGDFIFDQAGESQLWLVEKGGTWYELSRANGT